MRTTPITNVYGVVPLIILIAVLGAFGLLPWLLIPIALIAATFLKAFVFYKNNLIPASTWFFSLICLLLLATYKPEGFTYPLIFAVNSLHENGLPYAHYINIGKLIAGIVVAAFLWTDIRDDFRYFLSIRSWMIIVISVLVVLFLSVIVLKLGFYPKFTEYTLLFLLFNLVFTCFSEEAFYRLFVQSSVEKLSVTVLSSNILLSRFLGVSCATVVFVITHLPSTVDTLIVIFTAGAIYALIYAFTRSLFAAILTHFMVNALHFSLFEYPIQY
jgi:membrane protease YdiL (CAAX protease family)